MSLEGTIVNGTLVFDDPPPLPEGTRVDADLRVRIETESKPTLLSLLELAGTAKELPADFAEEHDHYIHGTPRRQTQVSE